MCIRDRFYRHRAQGELQWEFQTDNREIGEPLKLAYLFAEKRSGQPVASIAYVNTKDVETAKQLLAEITFQAVSYTHLDVYKRQTPGCAGAPCG